MFGVPPWLIKLGLLVAGLGALAIAYSAWRSSIYNEGWNAADAMWREKALEARIEKLEREKAALLVAEAEAEANAAELNRLKDELEKENADYAEKLKARGNKCPLTDDDIKRLRREQKRVHGRLRHKSAALARPIRTAAWAQSQGWRRCASGRG